MAEWTVLGAGVADRLGAVPTGAWRGSAMASAAATVAPVLGAEVTLKKSWSVLLQ